MKEDQAKARNWLTTTEASDKMEVGSQTIRNWVSDFGDEVGEKVGGRYRIYQAGLDKIKSGELSYDGKEKNKKK